MFGKYLIGVGIMLLILDGIMFYVLMRRTEPMTPEEADNLYVSTLMSVLVLVAGAFNL